MAQPPAEEAPPEQLLTGTTQSLADVSGSSSSRSTTRTPATSEDASHLEGLLQAEDEFGTAVEHHSRKEPNIDTANNNLMLHAVQNSMNTTFKREAAQKQRSQRGSHLTANNIDLEQHASATGRNVKVEHYGGFQCFTHNDRSHSDSELEADDITSNDNEPYQSERSSSNRRRANRRYSGKFGGAARCLVQCCRPEYCNMLLMQRLPILNWCRYYTSHKFYSDFIAGVTVGLTVIPQGLAYAAIANLPLQYGLYTAYMGCFVYMFLGTSKDLNLGPTAVVSLMTAEYLAEITDVDERVKYAVLLTFITGLIQLTLAALHLGFLTRFISHPVIAGFSSAAALIIALSQVDSLLGYSVGSRAFIPALWETILKLPQFWWPDCVLGACCVMMLLTLKSMGDANAKLSQSPNLTRNERITRIVVRYTSICRNAITAILCSIVAGIIDHYWPGTLTLTRSLKAGIPAPQLPELLLNHGDLSLLQVLQRFESGLLMIPIISLVEALAIAKAFANKNGYHIDSTQEFFALGTANTIGALFHSYPMTGSFSRTALSSQSGVQTPASNLWTSVLVVMALLFLSPLFYFVPKAGLSAIIICAVIPMVEWHEVKLLWNLRRVDLLPLLTTFFGCIVLGIELGLGLGVLVSVALLLYAAARPEVKIVTWLAPRNNVVLVKPQNALYFPCGEYLQNIVQDAVEQINRRRMEQQKLVVNKRTEADVQSPMDTPATSTMTISNNIRAAEAGNDADTPVVKLVFDAANITDLDSSTMQALKSIVDMVSKERHVRMYFLNLSDKMRNSLTNAGCKKVLLYDNASSETKLAAAEIMPMAPPMATATVHVVGAS